MVVEAGARDLLSYDCVWGVWGCVFLGSLPITGPCVCVWGGLPMNEDTHFFDILLTNRTHKKTEDMLIFPLALGSVQLTPKKFKLTQFSVEICGICRIEILGTLE